MFLCCRKRKDYLEWPDYFMSVAFLSAQRSKDPNSQVCVHVFYCENIACISRHTAPSTAFFSVEFSFDNKQYAINNDSMTNTLLLLYPTLCIFTFLKFSPMWKSNCPHEPSNWLFLFVLFFFFPLLCLQEANVKQFPPLGINKVYWLIGPRQW